MIDARSHKQTHKRLSMKRNEWVQITGTGHGVVGRDQQHNDDKARQKAPYAQQPREYDQQHAAELERIPHLHDKKRKTDSEYHGAKKIPLTKEQYNAIVAGMVAAVERGTAKRAAIEGVKVAAKSGTAQVSVNGRPLTLAWMIAFAPADAPEVAISVIVEGEEPGDVGGGKTAAPIVRAAFEKYFSATNRGMPKIEN